MNERDSGLLTFLIFCRGMVRVVVTMMFAGALCAAFLRFVWQAKGVTLTNEEVAGIIGAFTGAAALAIGMWFGSRNKPEPPAPPGNPPARPAA